MDRRIVEGLRTSYDNSIYGDYRYYIPMRLPNCRVRRPGKLYGDRVSIGECRFDRDNGDDGDSVHLHVRGTEGVSDV